MILMLRDVMKYVNPFNVVCIKDIKTSEVLFNDYAVYFDASKFNEVYGNKCYVLYIDNNENELDINIRIKGE